MIKEHELIMKDICTYIDKIIKYSNHVVYTIFYIDDEYKAIEVSFNRKISSSTFFKSISKIDGSYGVVSDIHEVENGKLYVLYLEPISEIRNKKIKKLKDNIK